MLEPEGSLLACVTQNVVSSMVPFNFKFEWQGVSAHLQIREGSILQTVGKLMLLLLLSSCRGPKIGTLCLLEKPTGICGWRVAGGRLDSWGTLNGVEIYRRVGVLSCVWQCQGKIKDLTSTINVTKSHQKVLSRGKTGKENIGNATRKKTGPLWYQYQIRDNIDSVSYYYFPDITQVKGAISYVRGWL